MNRLIKTRLAALVAGTVGLFLLTGIKADDKPKADTAKTDPTPKAITPKPLGDAVKKGLEYLVKQQNPNGGWGQGGGWRSRQSRRPRRWRASPGSARRRRHMYRRAGACAIQHIC